MTLRTWWEIIISKEKCRPPLLRSVKSDMIHFNSLVEETDMEDLFTDLGERMQFNGGEQGRIIDDLLF